MARASSSSLYKISDKTSFQNCDVCKYQNTTSEAVAYCTSCDEYLCTTCEKVHRGSKLTRNHKLLTGNSLPSSSTTVISKPLIMFCEDHTKMIVNMYCHSHDDIICDTCKLSSHRRCNTTDINQQAKQVKKNGSFKDTRTRLEELKSKYDKLKLSSIEDKQRIKSELEKSLQDMRQIRTDINEALDHIENTLSNEINQVKESKTKANVNHNAILDEALTQISDHLNSLKEYEKAREGDVMYVGMKKASNITRRYEDIISKMEDKFNRTEITFQINGKLYDMVKHLRSIDTVLIDNSRFSLLKNKSLTDGQGTRGGISHSSQTQKSLINLNVSGKRAIDVGSKGVYGCTFMPDGHLVLCCDVDGLILLDKDFNVQSRLNVRARSVAVVNHNEIVSVNDGEKMIKKVKLFPSMEAVETMRTDRNCCGVDVSGDEIYVTCHDCPGNGEVQVLNMKGTVQRRLGVNNGEYRFTRPGDVTVNKDGSKVFVSDSYTNIVMCLDKRGRVIYKYSDAVLNIPIGMCVDHEGNLLVCGNLSNNVHVIRQDGRKEKIVLSETDGIKRPWCTAFRQSDGCLVVGMYAHPTKSLISFTAK